MTEQPLTHQVHKTDSKAPLIAYFDASDLAVLGLTFFISINVSKKLIGSSAMQLVATGIAVLGVYLILMTVKRLLAPYPRITEHLINWYSKPDVFRVLPDPKPVPLYRSRPTELDEDKPS